MTASVPTLAEASRALCAGELTPVDLTRMSLERISACDGDLHAFITVTEERALAAAEAATAAIAAGRRKGPLHGIPYALKDNIDVNGVPTTAHSRILRDNLATADAAVTQRLEAAGMILVGKLSMHELARGSPSDVLPWPNARNPLNPDFYCGGSSSGSGVAVAAGMVPLAIGTDTGGSVRVPAACTGVVGLKPTNGRISCRGVLPLSFSLDAVGPLTATVEDCALALDVLSGCDGGVPASTDQRTEAFSSVLRNGVCGLRIGIARAYDVEAGVSSDQVNVVAKVANRLRIAGALVDEIVLPPKELFDAAAWAIISAEGFAIHQDNLIARPGDFGRTARERFSLGSLVTGAEYVQAQRLRRQLTEKLDAVFRDVDVIVCSTMLGAPPRVEQVDDGPWRKAQPITAPFSLTGHPALAIPAGPSSVPGLSLSVQLIGRHFEEALLLRAGYALERSAVCS